MTGQKYEARTLEDGRLCVRFMGNPGNSLRGMFRRLGYVHPGSDALEYAGDRDREKVLERVRLWAETPKERGWKPPSKCIDCQNAVPTRDGRRGCSWSRGFVPVKGWNAEKKESKRYSRGVLIRTEESYLVIDCPEFIADGRCVV